MQEHATAWDRHAILAEIKRRYGSLRGLADATQLTASELSASLSAPYPKADRVIAAALGQTVAALWPNRYWPNGRRRLSFTRPQQSNASQNAAHRADEEPVR